jgi:DNA primase
LKIPQEIIDKVKDSSDIVEVIGEFIPLKRRGTNFLGLCPFHKEKTPSFTVSPDKGIYKCFGCSKAGNVITFVSEYQGLNFTEAVQFLAHKYNIDIPRDSKPNESSPSSRNEIAYEAMNEAAEYYHKLLRKKEGTAALQYFHNRDFNDTIIDQFLLGYSPNEWELLTKRLLKQGFEEDILIDTGLSIRGERGNLYDRFRSRAMFAVRDFMGRVVGFGARLMIDDKSQPKYINSPQSLIYDKSKLLYGVYESKNAIRDKKFAIMVEGYADYLAMFRSGIENVVASSGTSLTVEQLTLLKRYTKSICFAYDGDEAGIHASVRGAEMALNSGFDVSVASIPEDQDPDSVIKVNGPVQMEYLIRDSVSYIEFAYKQAKKNGITESALTFSDFVRATVKAIVSIPDSLQHDFHIRKLSQLLDLSEKQLRQVYKYRSQYVNDQINQENRATNYDKEPSDFLNLSESQTLLNYEDLLINPNQIFNEEKLLLNYALKGLDEFTNLIERYDIEQSTFYTDTAKTVFGVIQSHSDKEKILDSIISDDALGNKVKNYIAEIALLEELPSDNWHKKFNADLLEVDTNSIIMDSKIKLKLRFVQQSIKEIQQLMSDDDDNINHKQRFLELLLKEKELNSLIYRT